MKKPADNSSSQRVGGRLKPRQRNDEDSDGGLLPAVEGHSLK